MGKRGAEAGEFAEKRYKSIHAFASSSSLHKELDSCYSGLTLEDLANNETWKRLVAPDMSRIHRYFDYMGRQLTLEVIEFILRPSQGPPRLLDLFADRKYITGTPGYGKTVSVCTAVGFLHVRSKIAAAEVVKPVAELIEAKASQASSSGHRDVDAEPKDIQLESTKLLVADLSKSRFLLLSGKAFVRNPAETFYMALVLAYVGDGDELPTESDVKGISLFLLSRKEKVYVIVDDGNAMDLDANDTPAQADAKLKAENFLANFDACSIIICASVRSSLRRQLAKTPGVQYLYCSGGFNVRELSAYLKHNKKKLEDLDHEKTGSVPRLVDQCLFSKGAMRNTIEALEKALLHQIVKSEGWERDQLVRAIAGRRISQLSDAMDSRCYYQASNGRASCLTSYLHSRAFGWLVQNTRREQVHDTEAQILLFTRSIPVTRNMCSIGWNAEAAAILALRLLDVDIAGTDVLPRPKAVRTVDRMTHKQLQTKVPTLFIPQDFNHIGADVYYADQEVIIVFQISVAKNAVKVHAKTKQVAEKIFAARDSRKKLLVWVLVEKRSSISESADYSEVFTTFGDLHYTLDCVDDKVKQLRGKENAVCRICGEATKGEEVNCDYCGDWYHGQCATYSAEEAWICPDCRIGHGLDESEEEDEGDSSENSKGEHEEEEDAVSED